MLSNERIGRFTSSEIYRLVNPKTVKTYVEEKRMERKFGTKLELDATSKEMTWGKECEAYVMEHTLFGYNYTSIDTIIHPDYDYWCGTPDCDRDDAVGEIKCPYTRKSFYELVNPLYEGFLGVDAINKVREMHKSGEKYYWQIVSNAILTGKDKAELIVFMPYASELDYIRQDSLESFIVHGADSMLPHLPDRGFFKNLNFIRFEIPQSDKDLLTDCVQKAGLLLNA